MIDYNKLGINSKCALMGIPYDERYSLFKEIGFESVLLWGGKEETPLQKRIETAKEYGVYVESVHAPYVGNTFIWNGGADCERYLEKLIELVKLLGDLKVKTLVLHPEGNEGLPTVNSDGLRRYMRLFEEASVADVDVAVENIHIIEPVKALLGAYSGKNVGFCFDSGHYNIWNNNCDMLELFGNRLKAIHLHDNDGVKDAHEPLFVGTIDWKTLAKKLAKTQYNGSLTLETKFKGQSERELVARLKAAYESGKRFAELLKKEYDLQEQ